MNSAPPIPGSTLRNREPASSPSRRLELVALVHAAGLVIFTTWDFGGETDFARLVISVWGSLALPLMALASLRRVAAGGGRPAALRWLWPLALFDALVLLSTLNPSFTTTLLGGAGALVHRGARPGWPSSARPVLTLQALWQFNAIYLTGFNLLLLVVRRRALRALLLVLTVNALALAVLGTFQKLGRSPGIYFGLQPSPNEEFFATFIYHNHWGAFALLSVAAALGLVFHHTRRSDHGEHRHSPVPFGLVSILFLAAAVPLSSSRSGTLLVFALLAGACIHWWWHRRREQSATGRAGPLPTALLAAFLVLGLGGIYLLDRPVIDKRIDTTRAQIEEIRRQGSLGSREQLYADTWHLAREKIWFGWGLGSYATVFQMYNQQVSVEGWVPFFAAAHSDWLQALAEVGIVGTALMLLMALVPLAALLRLGRPGPLPAFLFAGCGLLVMYALVEFPFANPAVMEVFWVCLFAAMRYHRLTVAES